MRPIVIKSVYTSSVFVNMISVENVSKGGLRKDWFDIGKFSKELAGTLWRQYSLAKTEGCFDHVNYDLLNTSKHLPV